jgi:hypothetical protein
MAREVVLESFLGAQEIYQRHFMVHPYDWASFLLLSLISLEAQS